MSLRLALSTPMPWLLILIGRLLGKSSGNKGTELITRKKRLKLFFLPRSLKFTKEGIAYTIFLIIIGAAAINTGNNLLYLVVAMMLSLIVISGLMSESTLKKIYVERSVPKTIHRDTPVRIGYTITNKKSMIPSYSIVLKEDINADLTIQTPGYLIKVSAGEEKHSSSSVIFNGRGKVSLGFITLSTRFPFGLFNKGRLIMSEALILVYPKITPIDETPPPGRGVHHGESIPVKGEGFELYGAREYGPGDDARHIMWKALARTNKLYIKEHEKELESEVTIFFNNLKEDSEQGSNEFESAVDRAASLAHNYFKHGYSVGLALMSSSIEPGSGVGQMERILTALALVKSEGTGKPTVRVIGT
ncbi:MAG: DUF58 domain-containing protein [Deltaproteobacteria bacterium]|nr:DUF58 domain-containing protein [Deltaproteobacteria bacterium]